MPKQKQKTSKQRFFVARDRRSALRHVVCQSTMWIDLRALRRFVGGPKSAIEKDLDSLVEEGSIELGYCKTYDTESEQFMAMKMARRK